MTYLANIPRTARELFDATADLSPEDARALQAEKLRRDQAQEQRIDRVLARGLIRPEPAPEFIHAPDYRWLLPTAAVLGALAALIGGAV